MNTPVSEIMVRIPTRGTIEESTVKSLLYIQRLFPILDIDTVRETLFVSSGRHRIVKEFLNSNKNYLIMIDDDVVPSPFPTPRIIELPDWKLDIVGGIYPGIKAEVLPYPHIYRRLENGSLSLVNPKDVAWGKKELVEVDAIGTGMICIHRRVFEHPDMKAPFLMGLDVDGITQVTDDIAFCARAKDAGFKIYADPSCLGDHRGQISLLRIEKLVTELKNSWEEENVGTIKH